MKITRCLIPALALVVSVFTASVAFAHQEHKKAADEGSMGELVAVTDKDATWLAKAKADYPLSTCVVSEDKLEGGEMGEPKDYIYRVEGKPDRLVRFCCKDCVKDFNKDPAKYLKVIDDAAAAKAKSGG